MARSQKVGVLTFHRCINYGSYWQARRLVEGLRARGQDALLLDHESGPVTRAEWRCALRPHEPFPTRPEDRPLYARKVRKFFEAFAKLPMTAPFRLEDPGQMESHDLIVVGSDEVWNPIHPWYGSYPAFFGHGLKAPRLISYAASFGNYDADIGLRADLSEGLRRFEAISVRDENSLRMIEKAVPAQAELVLDPCLQFGELRAPAANQNSDYIAVYGPSFPDWLGPAVRRWAKSRGYRLISIGYRIWPMGTGARGSSRTRPAMSATTWWRRRRTSPSAMPGSSPIRPTGGGPTWSSSAHRCCTSCCSLGSKQGGWT